MKKIHACPNGYILYWDGRENKDACDMCHTLQWRDSDMKLAHEVLSYFPPIPRRLRIYRPSKIAEDMIWHHKSRIKDDILRHPTDAKAWKDFDKLHSDFTAELRNVTLGLTSDGFNFFLHYE